MYRQAFLVIERSKTLPLRLRLRTRCLNSFFFLTRKAFVRGLKLWGVELLEKIKV